ncbi:MAG: antitoxin MazE family protein [Alphaproteobacteria bacterium]|nr:antitoxin MazE family protein [Alphaproteobacteria bacterium]
MTTSAARGNAAKVARYRARLRRQGLRPVQIWVPDTRAPRFAAEAHRQSRAAAASRHARRDMDFVEAIGDWAET